MTDRYVWTIAVDSANRYGLDREYTIVAPTATAALVEWTLLVATDDQPTSVRRGRKVDAVWTDGEAGQ